MSDDNREWSRRNKGLAKAVGGRGIWFRREYIRFGGVPTALFLSQAVQWTEWVISKEPERGGWFYKTQSEWCDDIGLTRREQETARKNLRDHGVLEERVEYMPTKLWFRVNLQRLVELLSEDEIAHEEDAQDVQAEMAVDANQDGGNRQTEMAADAMYNNIKTNNTSKKTDNGAAAPSKPKSYAFQQGRVKLNQRDYDERKRRFPNINLDEELRFFAGMTERQPDKDWFPHWLDGYLKGRDDKMRAEIAARVQIKTVPPPPKAKPKPTVRIDAEPAKPNGHPLPFTPFRVIDDMPPNTREGAAVMEQLKVAGLFDDYNICWTPKAERHRGKWVNPA